MMGTAHAVNLTAGLDGLAGHTAAVAYVAYGTSAYLQGQLFLVALCFTVAGALLAFLWFNAYPAQVFMGDAAALAQGHWQQQDDAQLEDMRLGSFISRQRSRWLRERIYHQ